MVENRDDQAISRVLGWPEWPFYLPGLVSLALWALVAATQTGEALRRRPAR
jgi:TRAP-type C4-dicarboxylate transport system permease small subunit